MIPKGKLSTISQSHNRYKGFINILPSCAPDC